MTFAETLSDQCATIAAAMGEAVTHTDGDGNETAIASATFAEQQPANSDNRDGQQCIRKAACTIAVADVASPARAETITRSADSSIWQIETDPIPVGGGDYWQLALTRAVDIEKTRPGHRLPRR